MNKIVLPAFLKDFVNQQVSALASHSKIFCVETGREAITIHRKEKGDLIVIEPDFPDMTCEQLCSTIRGDEDLKRASILIVCSDPSDLERCQTCGANDYIHPLNPVTFLRKALRLLRIPERARYRVIVKVSKKENGNIANTLCTSQNISSSGMLLEADGAMEKGDKITCSFFLPNSIKVVAEGEIVRTVEKNGGPRLCGVKFVDIPFSVESQIESFTEEWRKRKKRAG